MLTFSWQPDPKSPLTTLLSARFLWIVLLLGMLLFLGVILFLNLNQTPQASPANSPAPISDILFPVSLGMLFILIPLGYFIRNQIYKRNWQNDVVTPAAYFRANLILWCCCETIAFFGMTNAFVSRSLWPALLPSALAIAVMLVNYPHGRPMFPPQNPYHLQP